MPFNPEFFRLISEYTNDALLASDENFVINYWNRGAELIYGYPAQEAIGKRGQELMDTHFLEMSREEAIGRLRETGTLRVETLQKTRSGKKIFVEVNTHAIRDEKGKITGYISVNRDITQRKEVEKALAESERKFRHLTENAVDLIYRYDLQPYPHFSYVSPSSTRIIGYTPEEHYADPSLGFKLVHPDDRQLLSQLLELKPGDELKPAILRWIHKNGQIIYSEQKNTPVFDEDGTLIAIEGIARDITQQKNLEEELLLAYRLLDESARIGNFGGWSYNIQSNKFYWSPQLFDIYEFPPSWNEKGMEVMRKIYSEETLNQILTLFERAKTQGQEFFVECEINTWKNRKKWVRIMGKPIIQSGKTERISGTIQDITHQKLTEEKLSKSRKKLRKLYQKSQGMLEAERKRIAHELHDELGQLLTVVQLDLNSISKITRSPEIRSLTGQMKSALEIATDIVRRVSSELHPPLLDHLGPIPSLQWLLSQLSQRTKIKISTQLPDIEEIPYDFPHAIHVYRIVQESFTNIIKHSGATEVLINLIRESDKAQLTISDNGKGFNLEEQEENVHVGITGMFDRAEIMGGKLWVNSIPGQGTSIKLEFPINS
ncbi:MAG: PAS domain S-box protein [Bacteroidales bacterium]